MKKTIYIVHGWSTGPQNQDKWVLFRSLLEKGGFTTVFLKLPGLTTKLDTAWTLTDYVVWLEAQLPKQEAVFLLGHSFGGQISCQFAAQYPDRISKLVLVDSAGIIDRSVLKVCKRFIFKYLAKVGKIIFRSDFFRKILYKLAREKDYFNANEVQRKIMSNVINTEITSYLPEIKCETLIVWGEHDTVTPIQFAQIFRNKIKQSQLFIVPGAYHSPQFTHSKEVANRVKAFLR